MKRLALYLSIFAVLLGPVMNVGPVMAADANLIVNPSVETADSSGAPANWHQSRWGTNTTTFQYKTPGHTGNRSLYLAMTARTDGDAEWMQDPVSVQPNTSYTYASSYMSNITSEIDLQYTDTTGKISYVYVNSIDPSASWQTLSVDFVTPANVAKVAVMHLVAAPGWLQTDDFSLNKSVAAPPAAQDNYILNSSFETANGSLPASWYKNSWGTNSAQFSYETTGHTGTRSAKVTVSAYTSGDAKWFAEASPVTAGKSYLYQDYYKSTVPTQVVVAFIDAANNYTYQDLAAASTSSADWTKYSSTFTAPASAVKASVYHLISSVGSLTIDDVNLYLAAPTTTTTDPVIANPSFETASGTLPANWQKNNWGTNTATYQYVSEGHTGTKSAKVTMSQYVDGDAKWYFNPITSLQPGGQYRFTAWYKTNVTPHPVAMFTMADGSTQYFNMPVAQPSGSTTLWQKYSDTFIVPAGAVSSSVFLYINQNGWLQTDDYSLTAYHPTGFTRPLLTVTFDDGWASQYTNALPLLQKYGILSTFYILSGELADQPDYMSSTQVKNLYAAGNEIGSHTVTHADLTTVSQSQLVQEVSQSQLTLKNLIGVPVTDFASPYGDYNTNVLTQIKKYYRSHRSVDEGYNSKDNFNAYDLRVQNVLSTTSAGQVAAWIAQAKVDNTWLILVYHGVANNPGLYDSYTDVFKQHVQAIVNSGVTVKTVSGALDEVTAQLQ